MEEQHLLDRFKTYELGFPKLDNDHLDILKSIEVMRVLIPKGEINILDQSFTAFRKNADAHFAFEESVMRTYGYPFLNWHKEVHDGIRSKLAAVGNELKENKNKNRFLLEIKITDVLEKHFINHIDDLDRQMVQYLRDKGFLIEQIKA